MISSILECFFFIYTLFILGTTDFKCKQIISNRSIGMHSDNNWLTFIFEYSAQGTQYSKELTHWPLGDFKDIFRKVIFQLTLVIGGWSISCEIVLKWMSMDLTDGKSTLVQVMA